MPAIGARTSQSKATAALRLAALGSAALGVAALALFATTGAGTAEPVLIGNRVVLTYGTPNGPHAVVTFTKNRAATAALMIDTIQAGAAGSTVSILVDANPQPVFVHTLTADECRSENGVSRCTITVKGRVADYGRMLGAFRRSRVSKLQIETGGVMAMSQTTELTGFSKATKDMN